MARDKFESFLIDLMTWIVGFMIFAIVLISIAYLFIFLTSRGPRIYLSSLGYRESDLLAEVKNLIKYAAQTDIPYQLQVLRDKDSSSNNIKKDVINNFPTAEEPIIKTIIKTISDVNITVQFYVQTLEKDFAKIKKNTNKKDRLSDTIDFQIRNNDFQNHCNDIAKLVDEFLVAQTRNLIDEINQMIIRRRMIDSKFKPRILDFRKYLQVVRQQNDEILAIAASKVKSMVQEFADEENSDTDANFDREIVFDD